jgi:hypothetical protein
MPPVSNAGATLQQFEALVDEIDRLPRNAGDIGIRAGEVGHEAECDRIANPQHDDRDRLSRAHGGACRIARAHDDRVHVALDELIGEKCQLLLVGISGTVFDLEILSDGVSQIAECGEENSCVQAKGDPPGDSERDTPTARLCRAIAPIPRDSLSIAQQGAAGSDGDWPLDDSVHADRAQFPNSAQASATPAMQGARSQRRRPYASL